MRISEQQRREFQDNLKLLREQPREVREFLEKMGFVGEESEAIAINRREIPLSMERLAVLAQRFQDYRSPLRPGVSGDTAPSKPTRPAPDVIAASVPNEPPALGANEESLEFRAPSAEPGSLWMWHGWKIRTFDADDALDRFLAIRTAEDALAFATDYGPLWTCSMHPPDQAWESPCISDFRPGRDARGAYHSWENPEPMGWWLQAAGALRNAVACAARLDSGEQLAEDQLTGLGEDPSAFESTAEALGLALGSDPDRVAIARSIVHEYINTHLDKYRVTLAINPLWGVHLSTEMGILPALWLRALNRIVGGAVAVCYGCQTPYVRQKRAAKRGQANWCPACRENGLDKRASDRRRRELRK